MQMCTYMTCMYCGNWSYSCIEIIAHGRTTCISVVLGSQAQGLIQYAIWCSEQLLPGYALRRSFFLKHTALARFVHALRRERSPNSCSLWHVACGRANNRNSMSPPWTADRCPLNDAAERKLTQYLSQSSVIYYSQTTLVPLRCSFEDFPPTGNL